MKQSKAWLKWITFKDGGRKLPPPGPKYSTVARFKDKQHEWPKEAWSIVLDIKEQANAQGEMIASLRFLSSEAPMQLLYPGSEFDLFEGHRCVATGKILT